MKKVQIEANFDEHRISYVLEVPKYFTLEEINSFIKEDLISKISYKWEELF